MSTKVVVPYVARGAVPETVREDAVHTVVDDAASAQGGQFIRYSVNLQRTMGQLNLPVGALAAFPTLAGRYDANCDIVCDAVGCDIVCDAVDPGCDSIRCDAVCPCDAVNPCDAISPCDAVNPCDAISPCDAVNPCDAINPRP